MPGQTKHVLFLAACLGAGAADLLALNGLLVPRILGETRLEPESVTVAGETVKKPPEQPAALAVADTPGPAATPRDPTPAASPVEPVATAEPAPAPVVAGLEPPADILFGTRSAELSEVAKTRLHQVADVMRKDKSLRVVLRGHTDERGDTSKNFELGAARAESSARYISRLGVSRSRVSVESVGSREPLDTSGTREAFAKNRRVQFVWK